VGIAEPLNTNFPIVNPDGTPTEYFIRWAQQFSSNALPVDGITGGSGISVSPGPTISLDAGLDDLNDVDVSTTPPTLGQKLGWDGTMWVPQTVSGGGGGSWQVLYKWVQAADGNLTTPAIVDINSVDELVLLFDRVTTTSSANRFAQFSTDNGDTWISTGYIVSTATTGATAFNDSALYRDGNSTAASSMRWYLPTTKLIGAPKYAIGQRNTAIIEEAPFTTVQIGSNGTCNGGAIYVLGR